MKAKEVDTPAITGGIAVEQNTNSNVDYDDDDDDPSMELPIDYVPICNRGARACRKQELGRMGAWAQLSAFIPIAAWVKSAASGMVSSGRKVSCSHSPPGAIGVFLVGPQVALCCMRGE
jgi:hypothetical protein